MTLKNYGREVQGQKELPEAQSRQAALSRGVEKKAYRIKLDHAEMSAEVHE